MNGFETCSGEKTCLPVWVCYGSCLVARVVLVAVGCDG